MKYIILIFFLIISCKSYTSHKVDLNKKKEIMDEQSSFKKIMNENGTYALNYRVADNIDSPVKIFTYYVTDTATNRMIKKSEDVAAEKIYWKDNATLAIIPYTGMIQKNDVVGEVNKPNEILIKINNL